jgi:hypothetical protein
MTRNLLNRYLFREAEGKPPVKGLTYHSDHGTQYFAKFIP